MRLNPLHAHIEAPRPHTDKKRKEIFYTMPSLSQQEQRHHLQVGNALSEYRPAMLAKNTDDLASDNDKTSKRHITQPFRTIHLDSLHAQY